MEPAVCVRPGLLRFGERERQHIPLKPGLDLVAIQRRAQRDTALEAAIAHFGDMIVLLLFLAFVLPLGTDGQDIFIERDFDVFLIHTGKFGLDGGFAVCFRHFEAGRRIEPPGFIEAR